VEEGFFMIDCSRLRIKKVRLSDFLYSFGLLGVGFEWGADRMIHQLGIDRVFGGSIAKEFGRTELNKMWFEIAAFCCV
jgi:hypothetical protein